MEALFKQHQGSYSQIPDFLRHLGDYKALSLHEEEEEVTKVILSGCSTGAYQLFGLLDSERIQGDLFWG